MRIQRAQRASGQRARARLGFEKKGEGALVCLSCPSLELSFFLSRASPLLVGLGVEREEEEDARDLFAVLLLFVASVCVVCESRACRESARLCVKGGGEGERRCSLREAPCPLIPPAARKEARARRDCVRRSALSGDWRQARRISPGAGAGAPGAPAHGGERGRGGSPKRRRRESLLSLFLSLAPSSSCSVRSRTLGVERGSRHGPQPRPRCLWGHLPKWKFWGEGVVPV